MSWAITTMVLTFAASLVLTAAIRAAAGKFGVVDRPDGKRKLHDQPVPLWGGVAVYAATAIGLALRAVWGRATRRCCAFPVSGWSPPESSAWWAASTTASISPRVKLAAPNRLRAADRLLRLLRRSHRRLRLGNRVGVGRRAADGPLAAGLHQRPEPVRRHGRPGVDRRPLHRRHDGHDRRQPGPRHVAAMAMILAAALAGFLVYNLPPASVFLGDSGSMVIGPSVGMLGMQGTLKTSATLAITAPAVVMTLPLFDVVAAIGPAQAYRPPLRPARSASHPPSPPATAAGPLASPLPAGARLPFDRRRRRRRHDLPARRPGLDRRDDADRADDPPAALRAPRVCLGQGAVIRVLSWDSLMRRFRTLNPGPRILDPAPQSRPRSLGPLRPGPADLGRAGSRVPGLPRRSAPATCAGSTRGPVWTSLAAGRFRFRSPAATASSASCKRPVRGRFPGATGLRR